ncbi:histidine kinase [Kouleothrix sp.]|uniref:sensor histidine kinase n=1 Tax=Kouleothrix sp. TaxID=2779161 RepID=UPI0039195764
MTPQPTTSNLAAWADRPDQGARRLLGRWLLAARIGWVSLAGLAIVVLAVALPVFFQAVRVVRTPEAAVPGQLAPADIVLLQQWGVSLDAYAAYQTGLIAVFALVFLVAGALLFWRRSDDRVALLVSLWMVLLGVTGNPLLDPLLRDYPAWQTPVRLLQGTAIGCFPIFTYLFPDGRFVPRWTRILAITWILWIVVGPFTPFTVGDFTGASALWFAVLIPVSMGVGLAAQAYRYRRISSHDERLQARWVLFGFGVVALGFLLYGALPLLVPALREPTLARVLFLNFSETVLLVIPWFVLLACVGIAILRYRLYDIDLVINRTLVYGSLSAGVIGLYVLVVGGLGTLFQSSGNLALALLATGLAALLAQPLRASLQRRVNQLMYGERDDPYVVLSRLSQQLKTTLAPDTVLPGIAATVAQALKLPYVALAVQRGERLEVVASAGEPAGDPMALPLVYQAEGIGQLLVAPRAPGEAFTAAERQLLEDIALQAGAALHAIRLTADLQRSREQLVAAREEERRRLRRDLHDGLGPQLASLTLTIAAARELLRRDPQAADQLLGELTNHAQAAIADIRRIVYDLRPPALDDLGLLLALREQAAAYQQAGLQIIIDTPERLPTLPAAVEVAAYRIVQEAITNVVHHANAQRCVVRLRIDHGFSVEIQDDGRGLPATRRSGVGLTSIRERTTELGGTLRIESTAGEGTHVRVWLPLTKEHQ